MRVLLWPELFWPQIGGSETPVTALIDGLQHGGFEFTVARYGAAL